jgi:iron complex transport system substrate-binding protein
VSALLLWAGLLLLGGPSRIASLNLTSDEILAEILPQERLVAVTAVSDDAGISNVPGRLAKELPRFRRADLERLLALKPELVIVSEYTDADFLALLERSGLHYHRMAGLQSLSGVRKAILDLGRAVGESQGAEALAARFDSKLALLREHVRGEPRPRVLYWSDPMTAGAETVISDVIEAAGGTSVGKEMGLHGILPIGIERVFLSNPDYVLIARAPGVREALVAHPLLGKLQAVRSGKVIEMPNELLEALSQYAADATWYLGHVLHPALVPSSP